MKERDYGSLTPKLISVILPILARYFDFESATTSKGTHFTRMAFRHNDHILQNMRMIDEFQREQTNFEDYELYHLEEQFHQLFRHLVELIPPAVSDEQSEESSVIHIIKDK